METADVGTVSHPHPRPGGRLQVLDRVGQTAHALRFPVGGGPETDGGVFASCHHRASDRRDGGDRPAEAPEPAAVFPAGGVPQADGTVLPAGQERAAVSGKNDRTNRPVMAFHHTLAAALVDVPTPHGAVRPGAENGVVRRMPDERTDESVVAL